MVLHVPNRYMYDCNYRYGNALYGPSVGDIEKKYRTALSRTNVRNDRGDLGMYTFHGSHIHGGSPAFSPYTPSRYTSSRGPYGANLYEPLSSGEYGKGYYDHLRAPSPERRPRHKNYYDLKLDGSDYQTSPVSLSSVGYDDLGSKKVTKTVTTTERWVPLTTHIYHTPYHSYYYYASPYSSYTYRIADDMYDYGYVDDFKRYTKTTTSRNVDALDLSVSKNFESSQYYEKCQQIQKQLDEVSSWIKEAETKLKSEVVSSRSKMQSELAEISLIVEDTAKYNDDLHRVIKKQAKQISQLGSQSDEINRHLSEISETLEKSRSRCQSMQSEINTVNSLIVTSMKRRI